MSAVYKTVTGRRFDLGNLSSEEAAFLREVVDLYKRGSGWARFSGAWSDAFARSGVTDTSPAYRICQDLEARLGLAEGLIARPDYRDYLADLIEERFASRHEFCKVTGVDPGQLSRVLAHHADLSMEALERVARILNAAVVIQPAEEVAENLSPSIADRELAALNR